MQLINCTVQFIDCTHLGTLYLVLWFQMKRDSKMENFFTSEIRILCRYIIQEELMKKCHYFSLILLERWYFLHLSCWKIKPTHTKPGIVLLDGITLCCVPVERTKQLSQMKCPSRWYYSMLCTGWKDETTITNELSF
jgi:hypothetical protein